jgi:hypothetical protein
MQEFVQAVQQRAEIDDFMDTGVDPAIQQLLTSLIDAAHTFKRLEAELAQLTLSSSIATTSSKAYAYMSSTSSSRYR